MASELLLESQEKRWPRLVLQLDGLSPDPKSHARRPLRSQSRRRMGASSQRQDQQCGRPLWWCPRLCSKTGGQQQGCFILRHSAIGRLTRYPNAPAVKREAEEGWGR